MNATLWPVFGGFAIFLLLASASLSSASEPYPVPGEASARFEVRLDGVAVPVVAYKDIHYCHFRLDGAGEIEIIAKDGPVTSARLQPASRCLAAKLEGASVRFAMPGPMSLVAQLDFREKLFLFADGPAEAVPADALDAAKLGAVGDGKTDNTVLLQTALDRLPEGGTLVIPAGHFRSGHYIFARQGACTSKRAPCSRHSMITNRSPQSPERPPLSDFSSAPIWRTFQSPVLVRLTGTATSSARLMRRR